MDETSDIILSALARGKKDMLQTFLQQNHGKSDHFINLYLIYALTARFSDLMELMVNGVTPDETDTLDDKETRQLEQENAPRAPKPKAKPRKKVTDVSSSTGKKASDASPSTDQNVTLVTIQKGKKQSRWSRLEEEPQTRREESSSKH